MTTERCTAEWRERASCARRDTAMFFPESRGVGRAREIDRAKAVCAGCPVRDRCLSWALRMNVSGVWGGTSQPERRRMRASQPA